jgi:hypothetical protein
MGFFLKRPLFTTQPVAYNAPPTLSALSSSMGAYHPNDERGQPLGRQEARTASCGPRGCLFVHRRVSCPRTHWCAHQLETTTWRFQEMLSFATAALLSAGSGHGPAQALEAGGEHWHEEDVCV